MGYKSNLCLLRNYNNYFNRKVKRLDNLNDYINAVGSENYYILQETNFNPNDGVSTTHVFGGSTRSFEAPWTPDYMVETDERNIIVSRWFIIEFTRLMNGQYRATLKRDTPADKYIPLINAPCYIQKATLSEDNPLIVNKEGMDFNQIKIREYYLKDKSHVPWVVCYIPQDRESDVTVDVKTNLPPDSSIPSLDSDPLMRQLFLPEGQFRDYATVNELDDRQLAVNWWSIIPSSGFREKCHAINGTYKNLCIGEDPTYALFSGQIPLQNEDRNFATKLNARFQDIYNFIAPIIGVERSIRLEGQFPKPEENKVWRWANNFYRFKCEIRNDAVNVDQRVEGTLFKDIVRESFPSTIGYYLSQGTIRINNSNKVIYNMTLERVSAGDARYIVTTGTKHCNEVPYDILAFPLGAVKIKKGQTDVATVLRDVSLASGRSIALPKDQCFDVQILPFCPYPEMLDDNGNIDVSKGTENVDFLYVKKLEEGEMTDILSIALIPPSAYQSIKISKLGLYTTTDEEVSVSNVLRLRDRKEQNETDMWRLCSPNYASMFEFNISKIIPLNRDYISYFDVNITYRPYTPYIRVAPEFGFLYGINYEDARGLICNGQFSITLTDDKFLTYELQNKNYQQMFNRGIENLEVNRAIAREQEQWNIIDTSVGAGSSIFNSMGKMGMSMLGGAMVGGPVGAAMGAGAGAFGVIGSSVSGGMGIAKSVKQAGWNEKAYQELRDFKIDMFNMQIGNIKALPASITQSSAISYNFKFFPVLEYYTCTAKEKEQFRNKIKYNGMTVGLIGTISEYISNEEERYVQGELIRFENLDEDSHLAQDLYEEVIKGLFFEPYTPSNKEVDYVKEKR